MDLKYIPNHQLVELFALKTRSDHYEPGSTPEKVQKLRDAGISTDDLQDEILIRMNEQ